MLNQEKFSEVCTAHGIKHIFSANHNKFVRLFWFLIVLLSFCGFFFYLKNSWIKLMHEPEVLIKTRDKNAKDFPFPVITICPNVFARPNILNLSDIIAANKSLTDYECGLAFSNLMWFKPVMINILTFRLCSVEKLMKVNIAGAIRQSNIDPDPLFTVDNSKVVWSQTGLSGFGPCYTFNGLSYSELFNTENIHEDFKHFQKFLKGTEIEDNSTWSSEKGLKISNSSKLLPLKQSLSVYIRLSLIETKNLGGGESTFKIFVHKPNEIVTNLLDELTMNYNEVRICLI
jgi:Amiloride-sensitive sodium channel